MRKEGEEIHVETAEVRGGTCCRAAMESVKGACEITAAIRGSSAATASTWPPLNDDPHTTIRSGSTPS